MPIADLNIVPSRQQALDSLLAEQFVNSAEAKRPALESSLSKLSSDPKIREALLGGLDFGLNFTPTGSFGRVDELITPDQAIVIDRAKSALDLPLTTKDQDKSLELIRGLAESSGERDPVLDLILEKRLAGLEGLSAPELTAFREQGLSGIDQQVQQALRQVRGNAAASGIRGGALAGLQNQALRDSIRQRSDLEQQLLLKNVDVRASRLNELDDFGRFLDQNQFNKRLQATGAYGTAANQTAQIAETNRSGRLNDYNALRQSIEDRLLQRRIFNLGQLQKEKASQLGSTFGFGSFAAGEKGRDQAFDIANRQIEASKEIGAASPFDFSFITDLVNGGDRF